MAEEERRGPARPFSAIGVRSQPMTRGRAVRRHGNGGAAAAGAGERAAPGCGLRARTAPRRADIRRLLPAGLRFAPLSVSFCRLPAR